MDVERRQYPRHPVSHTVLVRPHDAESFEDIAVLRDVSERGMCFLSQWFDRYRAGQELDATVVNSDSSARSPQPVRVRATVVWAKPSPECDDEIRVGVRTD